MTGKFWELNQLQNSSNLIVRTQYERVSDSIDFLLNMFAAVNQPLFPRTMAAGNKFGIVVWNKSQILEHCVRANFVDCRINAYTVAIDDDLAAGLVAPSIIFVDMDSRLFREDRQTLDQMLVDVLDKIRNVLNVHPVVIWSGNGYHVYVLLNTRPLKYIKDFTDKILEPSKEFLKFVPLYLTNKQQDPQQPTSFKNHYLRIPSTVNSKNIAKGMTGEDAEVKLIYNKIQVAELTKNILLEYNFYLVNLAQIKEKMKSYSIINKKTKERRKIITRKGQGGVTLEAFTALNSEIVNDMSAYEWIEILYKKPIADNRYFCVWMIFARYYLNVLNLSEEACRDKIRDWLQRCNELNQVINLEVKLNKGIVSALESKKSPPSLQSLKQWNAENDGTYNEILKIVE